MTTLISIVALSIVAVLCTVAVFSVHYHDSWSERVGLSCIAIWCIARVMHKMQFGQETEAVHLFLHVGLMIYAIGVACRKYRQYRSEHSQLPGVPNA